MIFPSHVFRSITGFVILALTVIYSAAQSSPPTTANSSENSPEKALVARLFAAKSNEERTMLIEKQPVANKGLLAKEMLDEAERQSRKVSREFIEQIARLALNAAETAGNKREIARAWYAIGTAQTEFADEANAIKLESYNKALDAANQALADDIAVKIIIGMGQCQEAKDKEIEWYKNGLVNAERWPDKKVLSNLLGQIGNAYAQGGDFDTAREYHARSLEIKQKMGDRLGIATTASNIGVIYGMQGDRTSALESFKQSFAMLESLGEADSPDLVKRKAKDLRNLGIVYQGMGDDAQAVEYYSRSLKLSEDGKYKLGIFGALVQLATLYNGKGDYEQARQTLRQADGVSDDEQLSAELMGTLADSYLGEGRYDKAISARLKRLEFVEKNGEKVNAAGCLIDIGNIYLLMHNAEAAKTYFDRALSVNLKILDDAIGFSATIGLSKSKLIARDFAGALKLAEQAREYSKTLKGGQESWDLYSTIGSAYDGLDRSALAQANFEKAVSMIEEHRREIAGRSLDPDSVFSRSIAPFHLMTGSHIREKAFEKAFSFAERAKARTLLDALGSGKVNIETAMTTGERKAERDLKNGLVSLNAQIENENSSKTSLAKRLEELERQLADKRLEFGVFQNKVYAAHSGLRVARGELKPISLGETASFLGNDRSVILEFTVAEEKTYLFVIAEGADNKPSLKVFTTEINHKELAEKVELYRSKLAAGDLDFGQHSRELYDLLLKPAAAQLAGKTNIIVVPDGPLWNLPFQALQDQNGKYLTEQAAVSYAPSLTALREMMRKGKGKAAGAGAELIAFGNPIVGKETSSRVKQVFMGENLEPLPESERLVNELSKMYGPGRSKVYIGGTAGESVAKSEAPKYRIVQFATHGILNNASPMYSHLVLARNEKDPNEDGLLEAWELKDLDLRADMVILSACDTARGRISNGEGVIGMTWAAFIAGAPTTVASQWKVESKSTTELMLEFHRQLLTGKVSKAEALRRAELKVMKMPGYKHPSYWAGFVVVGDGS